jgi:hypothetical protein
MAAATPRLCSTMPPGRPRWSTSKPTTTAGRRARRLVHAAHGYVLARRDDDAIRALLSAEAFSSGDTVTARELLGNMSRVNGEDGRMPGDRYPSGPAAQPG